MEEPSTSERGSAGVAEEDDFEINVDVAEGLEGGPEDDKGAGKRKTMASAFAKILGKKSKASVPILSEGKVLNESKDREQQELRKRIQTNRKKKIEIREKGHVKSVKFGANPDQDEVEKRMVKTATKGVVRLFNAIYQAQRQLEKAGRNKEVANKAKTSLLQELEGAARNLGSKTEGEARNGGEREGGQGRGGAGWDVLSDGFTGLSGRTKLKDWDKEEEEELEMEMETIQESESEDESEDEEEI